MLITLAADTLEDIFREAKTTHRNLKFSYLGKFRTTDGVPLYFGAVSDDVINGEELAEHLKALRLQGVVFKTLTKDSGFQDYNLCVDGDFYAIHVEEYKFTQYDYDLLATMGIKG